MSAKFRFDSALMQCQAYRELYGFDFISAMPTNGKLEMPLSSM
jgi:hypothetical protein